MLSATAPSRKLAIAALFLTALIWSTGGIGFRLLETTNGLVISGYRSFFAALFYIVAFRTLPKMERGPHFKVAIVAYSFVTTLFVVSNTLTTAANAIVLQYTAPIFACLFLFFLFKKPLPKYDIIATVIIFVGIGIFFLDSLTLQVSASMTTGNIMAVASGAFFGLQAIVIGHARQPRNVFTFGNILNFFIALPFILMTPLLPFSDLLIILFLGIFQIGVSYLLFSYAVPRVTPLELLLIPAMEPILNPVWVFLFDGQTPSFLAMFGGVIIIVTIVFWSVYKERRRSSSHNDKYDLKQ